MFSKSKKKNKTYQLPNGSSIVFGSAPPNQALIGVEPFKGAIEQKHRVPKKD